MGDTALNPGKGSAQIQCWVNKYREKVFTPGGDITVEHWSPTGLANVSANNISLAAVTNTLDNFDYSTPTDATTQSTVDLDDFVPNNGTDNNISRATYFINVTAPISIRIRTTNQHAGRIELDANCSGEFVTMVDHVRAGGGSASGNSAAVALPVGIHRLRITGYDYDGANGNYAVQHNENGGFAGVDGTPPNNLQFSGSEPTERCFYGKLTAGSTDVIDTATGQVVTNPIVPCDDGAQAPIERQELCDATEGERVELVNIPFTYWELDTTAITGDLRNREWVDVRPGGGGYPAAERTKENGEALIDGFDRNQPTTTDNTFASLSVDDTDGTPARTDYQLLSGYIIVDDSSTHQYVGGSEGFIALDLFRDCATTSERLLCEARINSPASPQFTLPVGIHGVEVHNADLGGSNSSFTIQIDDGTGTFVNGTGDIQFSRTKPQYIKRYGFCCGETLFGKDGTEIQIDGVLLRDTDPNITPQAPVVAGYIPYCIADPADPEGTLKAFRFFKTDGTFGERQMLTDIDPDAVDCC